MLLQLFWSRPVQFPFVVFSDNDCLQFPEVEDEKGVTLFLFVEEIFRASRAVISLDVFFVVSWSSIWISHVPNSTRKTFEAI